MSSGAQVVTRGLFLMVVSSQDMMRVAGDGNKQLVICGSSQGAADRKAKLSGSHPAGSRRAPLFPLTSPDVTCPPQKQTAKSSVFLCCENIIS